MAADGRHFFSYAGGSLRSAPRPAFCWPATLRCAQSFFCGVHAAAKNGLEFIRGLRAVNSVRLCKAHFLPCEHLLPLPLGEVAERSEDGEGNAARSPFYHAKAASPSQSPAVTALPEGEPRLRLRAENGKAAFSRFAVYLGSRKIFLQQVPRVFVRGEVGGLPVTGWRKESFHDQSAVRHCSSREP